MFKKLQITFNFLIIFFVSVSISKAELLKPNSEIKPSEVVKIQLLGLQKNNDVFLLQSIIVCKNTYQKRLLEMVFYIQSPVSPVYIIDDENNTEQLYNNIIRHPQFYGSGVSAYFPK